MGQRVTCQGRHERPGYCCYCKGYFGSGALFGVRIFWVWHNACGGCLRHYLPYPLVHSIRLFLRSGNRAEKPEQLEGIHNGE